MKAFIEFYEDKPPVEYPIGGIHSCKDGIRLILDDNELPFPDDRFIPYSEIQKITIYGVNN